MSAAIQLVQRDAGYLLTDGATYSADVKLMRIGEKAHAFPASGFALTATGAENVGILAGLVLAGLGDFDAIMERGGERLRSWYEIGGGADVADPGYANQFTGRRGEANLLMVGWSRKDGRPKACGVYLYDEATDGNVTPFELAEIRGFGATPFPEMDACQAAGFAPFLSGSRDPIAIADSMTPDVDLLHFMEIQRRIHRPSVVGGLALLTKVTAEGIEQRVIHRWKEDAVGKFIEPLPIDWTAWRAERFRSASPNESRLQREMRERRERKTQRRAVR